jgi:centromere protein S
MELSKAAEQRSRLEAAHHFVVGRLAAEVVEDKFRVTFSPPALAAVANLSLHYIQESAEDLEAFAKHAKRSSVQSDDVRLLARKNPGLENHLDAIKPKPQ